MTGQPSVSTAIALVALSLVGLLISTYFTAVAYRWIRPDTRWIPAFCRMSDQSCASIVFSPRARVLGVPNSLLGQMFYVALLLGVPTGLVDRPGWQAIYVTASMLTVLLGIFLTYSLLFLTRVRCVLCFTSHAINLVVFLLLVIRG